MHSRVWLSLSLLGLACSRASESPPEPAPAPALAAPIAQPLALAITAAPQQTPSAADSGQYGVLWRTRIPGSIDGANDTEAPLVSGNEVVFRTPTETQVFDLATGAKLRSSKIAYTQVLAAHGALVARTEHEEVGLDPATLAPTWHVPAPYYLEAVGEYLIETAPPTQPPKLTLRRASDGKVMWENHEKVVAGRQPAQLDGDTLYVQVEVSFEPLRVAAIDLATGAVRWRTEGYLGSASAGRIAIQDERAGSALSFRIFDASGRARWRADGAWIWLHGDDAYASTWEPTRTLTCIDLATNRVLWRRTGVLALQGSERWLYAQTATDTLDVLDRATGELAGEIQLGEHWTGHEAPESPVLRIGSWLFGLGPRSAPEARKPVVARGCLTVLGCPGNSYAPKGAKVTIAGTTVTSDAHGCFEAHPALGLGPAHVEVTGADGKPLTLDSGFPRAVVFDGSLVPLTADYIGGGCHDSHPGGFP